MSIPVLLLQRFRVDRAPGSRTAAGIEELIVLVLKPNEGPEQAYAISKVDAMIIAHQMIAAAEDAKANTRD
jgi:hypothetical protein